MKLLLMLLLAQDISVQSSKIRDTQKGSVLTMTFKTSLPDGAVFNVTLQRRSHVLERRIQEENKVKPAVVTNRGDLASRREIEYYELKLDMTPTETMPKQATSAQHRFSFDVLIATQGVYVVQVSYEPMLQLTSVYEKAKDRLSWTFEQVVVRPAVMAKQLDEHAKEILDALGDIGTLIEKLRAPSAKQMGANEKAAAKKEIAKLRDRVQKRSKSTYLEVSCKLALDLIQDLETTVDNLGNVHQMTLVDEWTPEHPAEGAEETTPFPEAPKVPENIPYSKFGFVLTFPTMNKIRNTAYFICARETCSWTLSLLRFIAENVEEQKNDAGAALQAVKEALDRVRNGERHGWFAQLMKKDKKEGWRYDDALASVRLLLETSSPSQEDVKRIVAGLDELRGIALTGDVEYVEKKHDHESEPKGDKK